MRRMTLPSAGKDVEKQESSCILVKMRMTITLDSISVVSESVKYKFTIQPCKSTSRNLPKKNKNKSTQRHVCERL